MTKLSIDLHWKGPLRVGKMPENENEIKEKGLDCPGLYIYFQNYGENGVGIYVGKSNNLAKRIHEHLSGFLAFGYWLRDDTPHEYVYKDSMWNALGCFNKLDEKLEISKKEVERLTFFYCPYITDADPNIILQELQGIEADGEINHQELISWIEASLINDLKNENSNEAASSWVCDNGRKEAKGNLQVKKVTHIANGEKIENTISLINYLRSQLK